jgi:diguanylate cyclase (GGDEF)-like protein
MALPIEVAAASERSKRSFPISPRALGALAFLLLAVAYGLYGLFAWPSLDAHAVGTPIPFRALEEKANALSVAEAQQALEPLAAVKFLDTRLSEKPFWIAFDGPRQGESIHLPSRHLQMAQCWTLAGKPKLVGSASRTDASGALRAAKAGFAISPDGLAGQPLLCKASFRGPARVSVQHWGGGDLALSEMSWRWGAGLLEGAVLMLSAFVVIVAIVNRHWAYLIFAAWLVANLRLAGMSAGWDLSWFNHIVPAAEIYGLRKLAIVGFYGLTIAMLSALFPDALARIGYRWLLRILQWSTPILAAIAFTLDYSAFLPVMWVFASANIAGLTFLLYRIVKVTRSRAAMWFSAALLVTLLSSLVEVLAAAFGLKGWISAVNSVTAAMVSSLIAAMSIAEHLRRARADHMDTYRVSPIGLFTVDQQDLVVRGNDAFAHLVGVQGLALGFAWTKIFPPETLADIRKRLEVDPRVEMDLMRDIGDSARQWFHLSAIMGSDGVLECSLQDITERKASDENLLWLATHDPLTHLLNRRGLDVAVQAAHQAVQGGGRAAVAYLDLERFKLINDLYGHQTGDIVLREVADRIKREVRPEHALARIGGDEFVLVFTHVDLGEARSCCVGIIQALRNVPFVVGEKALRVGVSIGLVEMTPDLSVADTLATADNACRSAKESTGEHLTVYARDAAAFGDRVGELKILHRLDQEDFIGSLYLQYQPFLSLAAPFGSLNFEALLRMNDETGRPVNTGKMVASAEKAGLMQRIDRWVLLSVLKFLDENRENLVNTQFTCVNISGVSLNDESFVDDTMAMLREFPRVCSKLCFEVTETVALHDLRNTRRWMDRLKALDAKVALDDFGAGYTSFAYLRELPADALKIDGAFVRDMTRHPASSSIVQAMVDLAHNLGMRTVAEWVEDAQTIAALGQMGTDYAQGFGICRPIGPGDLLGAVCTGNLISEEAKAAVVSLDKTGYQNFRSALEGRIAHA